MLNFQAFFLQKDGEFPEKFFPDIKISRKLKSIRVSCSSIFSGEKARENVSRLKAYLTRIR